MIAQRWRGSGGEIDLVFSDGGIIFVEVKASRTHERAIASLGSPQIQRLLCSGEAFLEERFSTSLIDARFDLALVDQGMRIKILENAISA